MEQLSVFGRDAHFELVREGEKDLMDALGTWGSGLPLYVTANMIRGYISDISFCSENFVKNSIVSSQVQDTL